MLAVTVTLLFIVAILIGVVLFKFWVAAEEESAALKIELLRATRPVVVIQVEVEMARGPILLGPSSLV